MSDPKVAPWMREAAAGILQSANGCLPTHFGDTQAQIIALAYAPEAARLDKVLEAADRLAGITKSMHLNHGTEEYFSVCDWSDCEAASAYIAIRRELFPLGEK